MMMIPFFILNILFNGRLTKKGSINYYENNADLTTTFPAWAHFSLVKLFYLPIYLPIYAGILG